MTENPLIKVQRMVSLDDLEVLVEQLEALHRDIPRFELDKREDLVQEVTSLVDYTESTVKWFKAFSQFLSNINPSLDRKSEVKEYKDTRVENLIRRAMLYKAT